MADIRVQIPDELADRLRRSLDLESNQDIVQEALTLLNWAAEERARGRVILSATTKGTEPEQVAFGRKKPGSSAF
jgi:hypothetical protein